MSTTPGYLHARLPYQSRRRWKRSETYTSLHEWTNVREVGEADWPYDWRFRHICKFWVAIETYRSRYVCERSSHK